MRVIVICALLCAAATATNLRRAAPKDDAAIQPAAEEPKAEEAPAEEAPAAGQKESDPTDLEKFAPATIGHPAHLVGGMSPPSSNGETFKPQYTEFKNDALTTAVDAQKAKQDAMKGKTFKPEYMPAKPEKPHSIVTKGFCLKVLEKVQKKEAPYYIKGKFTGEMRQDLLDQCGANFCKWGMEYKKAVQDCDACPSNCDGDVGSFFNQLLNNAGAAAPIIKAIIHTAGKKGTDTVHIHIKKSDPEAQDPTEGYPLPAPETMKEGQDGGGPTRKFCIGVLKSIKAKQAPHYIDGKYTGEARTDLIEGCGAQICGWAVHYQDLLSSSPCADGPKGLKELLGDDKAIGEVVKAGEKAGEDAAPKEGEDAAPKEGEDAAPKEGADAAPKEGEAPAADAAKEGEAAPAADAAKEGEAAPAADAAKEGEAEPAADAAKADDAEPAADAAKADDAPAKAE